MIGEIRFYIFLTLPQRNFCFGGPEDSLYARLEQMHCIDRAREFEFGHFWPAPIQSGGSNFET